MKERLNTWESNKTMKTVAIPKPKAIYFSKENKKFHFDFMKKILSKNAKFSGIPENGILGNMLQNKGETILNI